jgi:hypothetical protein
VPRCGVEGDKRVLTEKGVEYLDMYGRTK